MAGWTPYSTDPVINAAYLKKTMLTQELLQCKKAYPDVQVKDGQKCVNNPVYNIYIGGRAIFRYDPTRYTMNGGQAPPEKLCDQRYAYVTSSQCAYIEKDLQEASKKLEDLERKESQAASDRKNAIASAARQAKQLADDAAALPGLKRDELACDEYRERTRCRQLRERIAAIEKNQAGSHNSKPVNSNNVSNPTQAQPAAPPKPFTAAPTPLPKPPLTRPTARPRAQRRTVRARRVSSASSN